MTVLDNIMLAPVELKKGSKEEIRERALALLARVVLSEKANAWRSPGPYACDRRSCCSTRPRRPSTRRWCARSSSVIDQLADEGMTMVLVTHEMGFAREVSDRVVFMADTVIKEEGPPEQIFGNSQEARTRDFISKEMKPTQLRLHGQLWRWEDARRGAGPVGPPSAGLGASPLPCPTRPHPPEVPAPRDPHGTPVRRCPRALPGSGAGGAIGVGAHRGGAAVRRGGAPGTGDGRRGLEFRC